MNTTSAMSVTLRVARSAIDEHPERPRFRAGPPKPGRGRARRETLLAEPRGVGPDRSISRAGTARISRAGRRLARRAQPPQVLDVDGRIAGSGRPQLLLGKAGRPGNNHAVRPVA